MARNEIPNEILVRALDAYQSKWMNRLEKEEESMDEPRFSHGFLYKMNKLISMQKKTYYIFINTLAKRVAIICLLAAITMSTTVFGVKALRDPAINFIVTVYEKISTVIFGDEDRKNENFPPLIEEYYEPTNIPEGFAIKESKDLKLLFQIEYTDKNNGNLLFEQFTIKSCQLNIDTEGTTYENITVNGNPGIYYSNKGYQNIIWNDGRYGYSLSGNIPREKLIEIAATIKKRE